MEDDEVVGFCVKAKMDSHSDISEFYVVPSYRRKGVKEKLAFAVFDAYPGKWQVRQIKGAEEAKKFWRKVVHKYTAGNYYEEEKDDPYWGPVTCLSSRR